LLSKVIFTITKKKKKKKYRPSVVVNDSNPITGEAVEFETLSQKKFFYYFGVIFSDFVCLLSYFLRTTYINGCVMSICGTKHFSKEK
jgi:high-affinity Fe2+/Pb2+ permease